MQGIVANTVKLIPRCAVGFIDWLGRLCPISSPISFFVSAAIQGAI